MTSTRRRIKRLSYRDQSGASQAAHQAHWDGFVAEAGNVIVSYVGPWGEVQFWGATEAEGRRVVEHACSIAGIPVTGPDVGEWVVTTGTGGRNGRPGTFAVPSADGTPVVSKRSGPNGPVYL